MHTHSITHTHTQLHRHTDTDTHTHTHTTHNTTQHNTHTHTHLYTHSILYENYASALKSNLLPIFSLSLLFRCSCELLQFQRVKFVSAWPQILHRKVSLKISNGLMGEGTLCSIDCLHYESSGGLINHTFY